MTRNGSAHWHGVYVRAVPACLSCILVLVPRDAQAFSYAEHCRVSNKGLVLAVLHASHTGPVPAPQRSLNSSSLAMLSPSVCKAGKGTSFGDLVALVDYALSPVDFYVGERNDSAAAMLRAGRIPGDVLKALGSDWRRNARAAHLNEDHFQDRALFSFWFWHRTAVSLAASGDLNGALLVEAYGEHFLEDSFAPGHMRTPRRDFHDAPSLGMHNYYNRIGATYVPRNTATLAALVGEAPPVEFDSLWPEANGSLSGYLATLERDGIFMQGDNRLVDNADQELFITLVAAKSADDVLSSYLGEGPRNSFEEYTWRGYSFDETGRYSPTASITFGDYRSVRERAPLVFMPILGIAAGQEALFGGGGSVARIGFGAELLVLGLPGGHWITSRKTGRPLAAGPQVGLLAGYSAARDAHVLAHGPTGRLVFPIRRLDSQFSVLLARREYRAKISEAWGWQTGAKFEMGMGLAFIGVGLARDHTYATNGRLRSSISLLSTIQVGWPLGQR